MGFLVRRRDSRSDRGQPLHHATFNFEPPRAEGESERVAGKNQHSHVASDQAKRRGERVDCPQGIATVVGGVLLILAE